MTVIQLRIMVSVLLGGNDANHKWNRLYVFRINIDKITAGYLFIYFVKLKAPFK